LGEPRWYHSTFVVVVALLLCFPIGLFCVCTHPRYTQRTKLLVTGVIAVLGLIGLVATATAEPEDEDVTAGETNQAPIDDVRDNTTTTTEEPTTTSSTTTTTEAPTTIRPPTTPPSPEGVTLGAGGQQATAPFRLDGGRYTVHYRFGGDCFHGGTLQSTSTDAFVYEDVGTGTGPIEADTNVYGIESGEYYIDMITGPAPDCPWEIVLTAVE
jgi:hypothetical protein